MTEPMNAYERWADVRDDQRGSDFKSYAYSIAEARFVMRRVTRIVNEQAKHRQLDPLLHQALLQIFGVPKGQELAVRRLAERLDVPAAFASRLVGQLERAGLVRRESSARDRRVTLVQITGAGIERLREIDEAVHYDVAYFQRQLDPRQRLAALSIFAFYVGVESTSAIASALHAEWDAIADG